MKNLWRQKRSWHILKAKEKTGEINTTNMSVWVWIPTLILFFYTLKKYIHNIHYVDNYFNFFYDLSWHAKLLFWKHRNQTGQYNLQFCVLPIWTVQNVGLYLRVHGCPESIRTSAQKLTPTIRKMINKGVKFRKVCSFVTYVAWIHWSST